MSHALKLLELHSILIDPVFQSKFKQAQIDLHAELYELKELVFDFIDIDEAELTMESLTAKLNDVHFNGNFTHEEILELPDIYINSISYICKDFSSSFDYKGLHVEFTHTEDRKIPCEDLQLLKDLGKIKTFTNSYDSVYCEVSS